MPNPIVHFEIGVNNMDKGMEFYQSLFGWKIDHDPQMTWAVISTGEEPGGGICSAGEEMPVGIYIYIKVDDIDAALKKAERLGGKITCPKKLISPQYGYYGLFTDPDGNMIGVWSMT
jgi:hypothetical protein